MASPSYELRDPRADRLNFDASVEEFDRVAFARRLLRLLAPPRLTVAIYECRRELRVEKGRDFARDARWGVLGVPRSASREHIAFAVAELAGVADRPFIVDLLAATRADETAASS